MTTLYLIRHAEAEGNAYRRIDGWYNSLITPNGLLQIEALRRRFEPIQIDACYASDLYRTCKTASSVYAPKNLPLTPTAPARGRTWPLGEPPLRRAGAVRTGAVLNNSATTPSTGTSRAVRRGQSLPRAFEAGLRDIAAANAGKTVAVFAHGSVLRAFQQRLLGSENVPYCDNTSVSRLTVEDGTFRIDFLNDASHLTPDISTFERQKWWRKAGDRSDFNMWYRRDRTGCSDALLHDTVVGHVSTQLSTPDTGEITALALEPAIGAAASASSSSAVPSVISAPGRESPRAAPAGAFGPRLLPLFRLCRAGSDTLERSIKVPKIQMIKTPHPPFGRWR